VLNPNPLATTPVAPTTGVKLSLSMVNPHRAAPQLYKLHAVDRSGPNLGTYSIKESEKESRASLDTGSGGAPGRTAEGGSERPSGLDEGTSLLSPARGNEGLKRRKPKTNLMKSNSSLISRVIPHDALSKRLQEQNPEAFFVFANIDRAFQWLDLSCTTFAKVAGFLVCGATHAKTTIRRNTSSKYYLAKHTCCAMTLTRTPKVRII
jgi:catabolite repression protein CreC